MAAIDTYLTQIISAIYGKDVRQAIHDAIEQTYTDTAASNEQTRQEAMEAINQLTIEAGAADMMQAVYDPDRDGIIDVEHGGTGTNSLAGLQQVALNAVEIEIGNLNDYRTIGLYFSSSGDSIANRPIAASSFGLMVLKNGSGTIEQIFFGYQSSTELFFYCRHYAGSSWSDWYRVIMSSGGSMTDSNRSGAVIRNNEVLASDASTAVSTSKLVFVRK